jgi:antirestriction protein ArdC
MKKNKSRTVYDIVTEKILEKLNEGQLPWRKTFERDHSGLLSNPFPKNFVSNTQYKGINILLLGFMCDFSRPLFATKKQLEKAGGNIMKGAWAEMVTFFTFSFYEILPGGKKKKITEEEAALLPAAKVMKYPIFQYYRVFNIDNIEGIEITTEHHSDIPGPDAAERIFEGMPNVPVVRQGGNQPYYDANTDHIQIPHKSQFEDLEMYYSVLFHEMAHAAIGHHRMNIKEQMEKKYGENAYAFEELVAELTAAFLCLRSGITYKTLETNASYIQTWLGKFKEMMGTNSQLIVQASQKAQKVAEYIEGKGQEMRKAA